MPTVIKSLNGLRLSGVPQHFMDRVIDTARKGDPDWILDLISEVEEQIPKTNKFYIPEFHGVFLGGSIPTQIPNFDKKRILDQIHASI